MSETNGEAAIGHNSEMSDEERRVLFFNHYRKISAQADTVALVKEELKKLRKTAKADGIVLADIAFAIRCATVDDSDIVVGELKRRTEIAKWMALPVEFQADMFGDGATPLDDRAYDKGRLARSLGKSADPMADGYEVSTDQGQAWLRGFGDQENPKAERAKKGGRKSGKSAVDAAPDPDAVRARSDAELAEPDEVMDQTFAERLRAQNDAVDAQLRGGTGGEPAAPAFVG